METGTKKGAKKATKLSLTKRAQKLQTIVGKKTDGIKDILEGKVDLNETHEFQQPQKLPDQGETKVKTENDRKVGAKTSTAKDNDNKTEDREEVVSCQVCNKNLSHMSLKCREYHVNRCIDNIEMSEKQQKEEQDLLESARAAVLDCPMCGKHFKSDNARLAHLKKCSSNVGVSTERLLQLVKDQERERQEQLSAGIVPRQLRSKITKPTVAKKRKLKEPKCQYEEDVQVAMAMSSSLAPETKLSDEVSAGDSEKDGKRKKNKKPALEDVCLLTTLTDEDRQRRMEEKISGILHLGSQKNFTKDSILHESDLKSSSQLQGHSLWKICSQDPATSDTEMFYVGALVPPLSVSHTEQGKNLRRLSSIPGREKSFVKKVDNSKCISGSDNTSSEDIITASTQTAVVLAELAVDDTDIQDSLVGSQLTPNPVQCDPVVDLQASGFCVEEMVLNKNNQDALFAETLSDYKKLINNKDYSDVSVLSCGQTFYSHKAILAVRCPKLLQMMADSSVSLDVPPDIVLCFLNYIYTGEVTLPSSAHLELKKLAMQLELPSLISACSKAVLQTETSDNIATDGNVNTADTEFIESHLDMKEIWGESDSDLDLDRVDHSDDRESQQDLSDSEINDEEYREISCTQSLRSLRQRMAQDIDKSLKSDEKSMVSVHISESCSIGHSLNKVDHIEEKDQLDADSAANLSSAFKKKYTKSPVHLADTDTEKELEIKRIRLDKEVRCGMDNLPVTDDPKNQKDNINKEKLESSTCMSKCLADTNEQEETANTTDGVINSSAADLFSPTPKKSSLTFTDMRMLSNKMSSPEYSQRNKIQFSTPVEYKTNSKIAENVCSLPVTPVVNLEIDLNSSLDLIDVIQEEKNQCNLSVCSLNENQCENSMQRRSAVKTCDENEELVKMESAEEVKSYTQQTNPDSSDDDLQITGDNFADLTQQSPTFNHMKRCSVSSQSVSKTKYLGLSMTEDLSDEGQLKATERKHLEKFLKTGKHTSSEEVDTVETQENEISDVNNVKPHKTKPFNDYASESDEIVTILTEDSDDCYDDMKAEMNRTLTNDDNDEVLSNVKLNFNDITASALEGSPERRDRKSAGYGKHELSVYSGDEENTTTLSPHQSFEGNKTDVWEDFDDCGIVYEPASQSPGNKKLQEASPRTDCLQIDEDSPQLSPVIPEQNNTIDNSHCEDDNNICGDSVEKELNSNLLDDGDDSFVFKVDDQSEICEVSAKTSGQKKADFKTPTIGEKCGKKRDAWVPPSPFTPMPQFGDMPTPALKKEVQKYGVKPVSRKRMVKVLEDIYQQTHQYETDSDFEEVEVKNEVNSGKLKSTETLWENLHSSQDDISSQSSDISDLLEESCIHMSSDSDTTNSPQKSTDVTRKLFDFIKSQPEVHTKVLLYEPLELDVLKKDVKEAGIRCSMDKLMDFLDERCIAFTSKNTRKRQMGRRGQRKSKPKQTESCVTVA